ncbi:MAG TPA: FAD-dependent oxidoreductase [Vicinamibacterales bacterium]|nr:FAD-dependent oxidoreductase [Vicinamibacterales bacterium]
MILTLPVAEIRRATPQSRILRLALAAPFQYEPGQSALIGIHGQPDRRHYSLATPPEVAAGEGALEFLVRTERDGGIGPHLDGLHRDTLVDVEGPVGRFILPRAFPERRCLFVAGGTGIAPIRAMLLRAAAMPGLSLSLAYSARTSREFAWLKELEAMRRDGFRMLLTATRDAPESWKHDRGRLNRTRLAGLIESPDTLCFVCGPPALVEDVPRILMDLAIEEGRIRTEIF